MIIRMLEQAVVANGLLFSAYVPLIASLYIFFAFRRHPKAPSAWARLLYNYMITYVLFVAIRLSFSLYSRWRVTTFDLNGDGAYSIIEKTRDFHFFFMRSMDDLTIPIGSGTFIAPVILAIAFILFLLLRLVTKLIRKLWTQRGV